MAESIRKKILKERLAVLTAMPSLATKLIGTFEPSKLTKPIGAIIPAECASIQGNYGKSKRAWTMHVRVIVDEGIESAGLELEDLLAEVEAAMLVDKTCGGFAESTQIQSTRWLYLDKDYPQAGADIELKIQYETQLGDPLTN